MRRIVIIILIAGFTTALAIVGCSDDSNGPGNSFSVENTLVFERTDGSRIGFKPEVSIRCGPWERGEVPVAALHIMGLDGAGNYWSLRAVLDDIGPGKRIDFPNSFIWNEPSGVDIFVFDAPNEISTAQPPVPPVPLRLLV